MTVFCLFRNSDRRIRLCISHQSGTNIRTNRNQCLNDNHKCSSNSLEEGPPDGRNPAVPSPTAAGAEPGILRTMDVSAGMRYGHYVYASNDKVYRHATSGKRVFPHRADCLLLSGGCVRRSLPGSLTSWDLLRLVDAVKWRTH